MNRFIGLTAMAALILVLTISAPAARAQDLSGMRAHPPLHILTPARAHSDLLPPGAETPGSIACVYQLVAQTRGCPITSKALPKGGIGAIALVDAFDNPDAVRDLEVFARHFGIKYKFFEKVYATGTQPPINYGWAVEEALDIEMAAAMAPNAKIYLVEAASDSLNDLYFAEQVAADLVVKAGGGVISNSWGGGEYAGELQDEQTYFSRPNVVYFASSGDTGFTGVPAVFANVVGVGGTLIGRLPAGDFAAEMYWYPYGGDGLSQFEPRPAYQDIIESIVGSQRGVPDLAAVATNVAIYDHFNGGWLTVAGTSISSPLLAGIVNAAASKAESTQAELTQIYKDYAHKKLWKAEFRDITYPDLGRGDCEIGWDFCAGVGTPLGYQGK
jgi:kumamolisin